MSLPLKRPTPWSLPYSSEIIDLSFRTILFYRVNNEVQLSGTGQRMPAETFPRSCEINITHKLHTLRATLCYDDSPVFNGLIYLQLDFFPSSLFKTNAESILPKKRSFFGHGGFSPGFEKKPGFIRHHTRSIRTAKPKPPPAQSEAIPRLKFSANI